MNTMFPSYLLQKPIRHSLISRLKPAYTQLVVCSVMFLVIGCAVGPDYRTPKVSAPESWSASQQNETSALEDVESALAVYTGEQVRHKNLAEAVNANRRAVELASELFTRGLANFLYVLDAERSLYESEDNLAQSEHTVSLNLVSLYKALGGGWEKETS